MPASRTLRGTGRPESLPHGLHLRLPARAILAAPELHGFGVVQDVAVFFARREHAVDAVGDVAEVAEQGALVAFLDVGVGAFAGLDAVEEVGDVLARRCRRPLRPPTSLSSRS